MIRSRITLLLFGLAAVLALRPQTLARHLSFASTASPASGLSASPLRLEGDPTPADLRALLAAASTNVRRGDRVAVLFGEGRGGYSYDYWRAAYHTAGATLLPPAEVSGATLILVWAAEPPAGEVIWRDRRGLLVRGAH